MKYYEATNGWMGESYMRCYVFANDEQEAQELARESFRNAKDPSAKDPSFYENIHLTLLIDTEKDTESFCTEVTEG